MNLSVSSVSQVDSSPYHYAKSTVDTVLWAVSHEKVWTVSLIVLKFASTLVISINIAVGLGGAFLAGVCAFCHRNGDPKDYAIHKQWAFYFLSSALVPGLPFYLCHKANQWMANKYRRTIALEKKENELKNQKIQAQQNLQKAITELNLNGVESMTLDQLNQLPELVYAHPETLEQILLNPHCFELSHSKEGNILHRLADVKELEWTEEHDTIVAELIKNHAGLLEHQDCEGFTPLVRAASIGHPLFSILLDAKQDSRLHEINGRSLLALAFEGQSLEQPSYVLSKILENISGIEAQNAYLTANWPQIYAYLEQKLQAANYLNLEEDDQKMIQSLIQKKLFLESPYSNNWIIRLPIVATKFPLLAHVIESSKPEIKDRFRFSADYIGTISSMSLEDLKTIPVEIICNPIILRYALVNPAIIDWRTAHGGNILHQFATLPNYYWDEAHREALNNFLEKNKALLREQDANGNTPLSLSVWEGSPSFKVLLKFEDRVQSHTHHNELTLISQFVKTRSGVSETKTWIRLILEKIPENEKLEHIKTTLSQICSLVENFVSTIDPITLGGCMEILGLSLRLMDISRAFGYKSGSEEGIPGEVLEVFSDKVVEQNTPLLQQALARGRAAWSEDL